MKKTIRYAKEDYQTAWLYSKNKEETHLEDRLIGIGLEKGKLESVTNTDYNTIHQLLIK